MAEYKDERYWGFGDPLMEDILPYRVEDGKKVYLNYQIAVFGDDSERTIPLELDYIEKRLKAFEEMGEKEEIEKLLKVKERRLDGWYI